MPRLAPAIKRAGRKNGSHPPTHPPSEPGLLPGFRITAHIREAHERLRNFARIAGSGAAGGQSIAERISRVKQWQKGVSSGLTFGRADDVVQAAPLITDIASISTPDLRIVRRVPVSVLIDCARRLC